MHALHSLFTEFETGGRFVTPASFFRSWALSCILAKRAFGSIELVTDDNGAQLLVGIMGLPYDKVDLSLNEIRGKYHRELWEIGKIKAYSIQNKPFCHIDGDFFILKELPKKVWHAPITVQSLEGISPYYKGVYDLERYKALGYVFPKSWDWCLASTGEYQFAANMGFYAATNLQLKNMYCREVIAFMDNPINACILEQNPEWGPGVCGEQFTATSIPRMHGVFVNCLVGEYGMPNWDADFVHLYWKYKAEAYHDKMITAKLKELAPEFLDRAEQAAAAMQVY